MAGDEECDRKQRMNFEEQAATLDRKAVAELLASHQQLAASSRAQSAEIAELRAEIAPLRTRLAELEGKAEIGDRIASAAYGLD